jgi:hypothetical protein
MFIDYSHSQWIQSLEIVNRVQITGNWIFNLSF